MQCKVVTAWNFLKAAEQNFSEHFFFSFRRCFLSCTLFVAGVSSTSDQAVHKEQDALEQALKNGAIRTYALTGTYPESLSQLLSDYHITYDKTKFVVEYVPNGSNLLPSISVIALSGSAKGGNAS